MDDYRESQHCPRQSRRRDASARRGADRRRHRRVRQPLTSAEIYSLADGTFTEVPTGLTTGVSGLTATVLNDNTVLLAGGLNSSGASVASAELYDPSQNAFVALPR